MGKPESIGKTVTWQAAMKRSKRKALPNNKLGRMREKLEHLKAGARAKVEHPFHVFEASRCAFSGGVEFSLKIDAGPRIMS